MIEEQKWMPTLHLNEIKNCLQLRANIKFIINKGLIAKKLEQKGCNMLLLSRMRDFGNRNGQHLG